MQDKRYDLVAARDALMSPSSDKPGVFETLLGIRTSTNRLTAVHVMNDLAQCVVGGAPAHGGDILCRVVREQSKSIEPPEDNSHQALRADSEVGELFAEAYPESLGAAQTSRLREAARLLLNADGRMYRAGDRMASGVATHWTFLGFEGFRRFGTGRYLATLLGEEGRQQIKALYCDYEDDPVTRGLAPLRFEAPLKDTHPGEFQGALNAFDDAFGVRLRRLLKHPLSKPTLLRYLALGACFGVVLKVLGMGQRGGRPLLLALPRTPADRRAVSALREPAVRSLARMVADMDQRLGASLMSDRALWQALRSPADGAKCVTAPAGDDELDGLRLVRALRQSADSKIYWPDDYARALGRRLGAIGPQDNRARWGEHITLTPDLVEVLTLMTVEPDEKAPWSSVWRDIRDHLGVMIGACEDEDVMTLAEAGVPRVSMDQLVENNDRILRYALRRGVARQLPDSGAEAGGALT